MQTEFDTKPRSFEYRGSDKIHSLTMLMICVLVLCVIGYLEKGIEAAVVCFVLFGPFCLLLVPDLMRNRQDVLTFNFNSNECHVKSRRLFLADQVTIFGRDEVAVIGALEFHGDGGPFFRPVVRVNSGRQFAFGADTISVFSAHAKAKEFAEALGLDYQENILQEVVSTAAEEVKADA